MAHQSTMLALGTTAPDFAWRAVATGKTVTLANFAEGALVGVFLRAHGSPADRNGHARGESAEQRRDTKSLLSSIHRLGAEAFILIGSR